MSMSTRKREHKGIQRRPRARVTKHSTSSTNMIKLNQVESVTAKIKRHCIVCIVWWIVHLSLANLVCSRALLCIISYPFQITFTCVNYDPNTICLRACLRHCRPSPNAYHSLPIPKSHGKNNAVPNQCCIQMRISWEKDIPRKYPRAEKTCAHEE